MEKLRVASVQFNHHPGDKAYNLAVIEHYVKSAQTQGVELICFPEMCISGYWHVSKLSREQIVQLAEPIPAGSSSQQILSLSKQTGINIGVGLIEIDEQGCLYNTFILAMPNGNITKHRKLHTFVSPHMSSGDQYTVVETPQGWRVGILICWDNNLVENVRMTALKGADVLLAPHQTGGCHSRSPNAMGRIEPQLWLNRHKDPEAIRTEMQGRKGRAWLMRWLPARAHDNGLFLIFSNGVGVDMDEVRTGNAMILNPYGETMVETDAIDNAMIIADLDPKELDMCTGRRWIRGRRPELYRELAQRQGYELDPLSCPV
ncbi:acyltransferase [Vibrio europaeus]|uniref:Acyltransferase n=1 Tax=Vibrio europaeus TaxID=300876 RepID=A0AAE7DYD6_9VIBR|nr:nitrilase family protein [Vibrio europaeus]QJY38484.1 acyltransferase [Vibrio europaeus]